MRKLTVRGIHLKTSLKPKTSKQSKAYPGGVQDVLGIPRKQCGFENLKAGLEKLGLNGLNSKMSDHELDAITCAYVGKLFSEGSSHRGYCYA